MPYPPRTTLCRRASAALLLAALALTPQLPALAQSSDAPARAHLVGRLDRAAPVTFALALPLRNQAGLDDLLRGLADPGDPRFGHYLTPQQFAQQFAPTPQDYQAVADWARAQGLTVTGTHPNRLLLDVSGPAAAVELALGVRLRRFQADDGRLFRAPDAAAQVPSPLAGRMSGVVGLDTAPLRQPHLRRLNLPADAPRITGSGPGGGLSPADVKAAYGLDGAALDGSGQTLAVFELDGYTPSDIRAYEDNFGLPHVPLQNVLVDGVTGRPGFGPNPGPDEVTLDIELSNALVPRAAKILVYEGPNTDQGILDTYSRIASDNQAKTVSTSWGFPESQVSSATVNAENAIFQQMAAQGQSVFSATGDFGAYDDGSTLSVDDPGSQPFVTGVGGTTLSTYGPVGAWRSETTWSDPTTRPTASGGGGGVSAKWGQPTYQQGLASGANLGSSTMRNVPDVAFNANPNTGYAIFYAGQWQVFGGTSTGAPLWSGFTALVNQQRNLAGRSSLGFANPPLYAIGKGGNYGRDFHDIADGSTNLFYPAVAGYDLATGWGSFNGAFLLADLAGVPAPAAAGPLAFPAGLSLFSLPSDYSGVGPDALFGYTGVRLFVYDPAINQYDTTPQPPADAVRLGRGYWVRFPQAVTVAAPGRPADATVPFPFGVSAGWNQIGDPFPSSIALSNLQVVQGGQSFSFVQAEQAGLISDTLYRYDGAGNRYVPLGEGGALLPGQGYWVYATQPVTLQVPPP